jgi:hypothetical protein
MQILADTLSGRERELRQFFDLIESGERSPSVEDALNRAFERFTGLLPYERISCAFLSGDRTILSVYWARSELGPMQISAGYSQPLAGTGLEQVLQTGHELSPNLGDGRGQAAAV